MQYVQYVGVCVCKNKRSSCIIILHVVYAGGYENKNKMLQ